MVCDDSQMVSSLIKIRAGRSLCVPFGCCLSDEKAFCRNINSPFFTLMLLSSADSCNSLACPTHKIGNQTKSEDESETAQCYSEG